MRQLDQWLAQGRLLWSVSVPKIGDIECWHVGSGVCIVQRYARGGWDLYTSPNTNRITETLDGAATRLGALTLADCIEAGIGGES